MPTVFTAIQCLGRAVQRVFSAARSQAGGLPSDLPTYRQIVLGISQQISS
jgi:hypothetical protein